MLRRTRLWAIYALREGKSDEVRYIGQARLAFPQETLEQACERRLKGHICCAMSVSKPDDRPVSVWLRSCLFDVVTDPIGLCTSSTTSAYGDNDGAFCTERWWIRALLRDGHRLCNVIYAQGNGRKNALSP